MFQAVFMCFFTLFGFIWVLGARGGGGGSQGIGAHNLLLQFFTLDGSKIEVPKTYYFDIVTTPYDHPRYVKHVFGRIYVFFTVFGYWVPGGGGGGLPGVHCLGSFSPWTAQNRIFLIP